MDCLDVVEIYRAWPDNPIRSWLERHRGWDVSQPRRYWRDHDVRQLHVGLVAGDEEHGTSAPRWRHVRPPNLAAPHSQGSSARPSPATASSQPNSSPVSGSSV